MVKKDTNTLSSDGAHQSMLESSKAPEILSARQIKKNGEYEDIQNFLRSISSTATLPPYVKGETYSSWKGVLNQCLVTCAVLILAAGAGHPIGFSAVALPQLRIENSTMQIDDHMGSWIVVVKKTVARFLPGIGSSLMSDYFWSVCPRIPLLILFRTGVAAAGMCVGIIIREAQIAQDSALKLIEQLASIHSAATPLGSIISGPIMEAFGRRRTLQASTLPLVIGWIFIGTATHHALLLLGRVICGFAVGIMAAPSQVYLGEISEPRLRGLLIGTPFVAYSLGVLYVYALGGALPWRTVAYFCILLPVLAFIALCLSPESPTWLARRGRFHEARAALSRLRGDLDTAQKELHDLISAREKEKNRGEVEIRFLEAVSRLPVLKPLLLINAFNLLQILSGSYIVIFYAVDILDKTGGSVNSQMAANATALVRLAVTVIACILLLRITRRALVIISGLGTAVCTLGLSYIMYTSDGGDLGIEPAAFILGYVAFNTLGFFLLPGLMVGELLPTKIRGLCGGYIFCLFNLLLFGFTKAFPSLYAALGNSGTFALFGGSALLATMILFLMLPETKNKSLLQIEQYYQKPNILWLTRKESSANVGRT